MVERQEIHHKNRWPAVILLLVYMFVLIAAGVSFLQNQRPKPAARCRCEINGAPKDYGYRHSTFTLVLPGCQFTVFYESINEQADDAGRPGIAGH